ncbi:MAG: hypothetical protein V2A56_03560, partial [bacterium]
GSDTRMTAICWPIAGCFSLSFIAPDAHPGTRSQGLKKSGRAQGQPLLYVAPFHQRHTLCGTPAAWN